MKTSLFSVLCAAVLVFAACDSKKPQPAGVPESQATQPGMDLELAAITPNFEITRSGAQIGAWSTDYEAALKLAAEKKVPIILNFTGSDWCKYCKYLMRDVFNQKEWQDWVADKFILVYLDFPRNQELISEDLIRQNSMLREKYGVEAFPTLLVLEDNGAPLDIVEMRTDNSVQTVKRNLKSIIRRRKSVIQQMIATLPEAKRIETQALYDKINNDQKKMSDMAKKYEAEMQKLQDGLRDMSEKTEQAILEHILSQRTPEQQQQYAEAKEQLEKMQQQLNAWFANNPEQNQQNMILYKNFQKQLQEQSDILADIIDPD